MIFAERAMMLLAETAGKEIAQDVVEHALHESRTTGQTLPRGAGQRAADRHAPQRRATQHDRLPDEYLGVAEVLRLRLLSE